MWKKRVVSFVLLISILFPCVSTCGFAKAKGKEPVELLELLKEYSAKLTGGNAIAPAERPALLSAMEESLENEETEQFQKAVQMLKIMGKL